jgi:transformation/transcription domain-associated protein
MLPLQTLSFIAYILRSFVQNLKPHQEAIAEAVIGLMKDCPSDDSATRKELLVATRHIWFSDFRTSFLKYVDVLLDENVLVSPGLTSRETLR